jgi:hypothetical protein
MQERDASVDRLSQARSVAIKVLSWLIVTCVPFQEPDQQAKVLGLNA